MEHQAQRLQCNFTPEYCQRQKLTNMVVLSKRSIHCQEVELPASLQIGVSLLSQQMDVSMPH